MGPLNKALTVVSMQPASVSTVGVCGAEREECKACLRLCVGRCSCSRSCRWQQCSSRGLEACCGGLSTCVLAGCSSCCTAAGLETHGSTSLLRSPAAADSCCSAAVRQYACSRVSLGSQQGGGFPCSPSVYSWPLLVALCCWPKRLVCGVLGCVLLCTIDAQVVPPVVLARSGQQPAPSMKLATWLARLLCHTLASVAFSLAAYDSSRNSFGAC